jgi:hypothetical protein
MLHRFSQCFEPASMFRRYVLRGELRENLGRAWREGTMMRLWVKKWWQRF